MSHAYDVSAWHDFATGLAGASAALTGLVLVAMSIRLRAVLAEPIHRLRAESAFLSLLAVLGLALVALFAGISRQAYGAVVVAVALVRLVHIARDARVFVGEPGSEGWLMLLAHVVSSVAELWGGIGLLTRSGGGMYVLAAGLLIHGGIALRVFGSYSSASAKKKRQRFLKRTRSVLQGAVSDGRLGVGTAVAPQPDGTRPHRRAVSPVRSPK